MGMENERKIPQIDLALDTGDTTKKQYSVIDGFEIKPEVQEIDTISSLHEKKEYQELLKKLRTTSQNLKKRIACD